MLKNIKISKMIKLSKICDDSFVTHSFLSILIILLLLLLFQLFIILIILLYYYTIPIVFIFKN